MPRSPGQVLVPISDTACCHSNLRLQLQFSAFGAFLLPVWLRVTACSDSPVARRSGFSIRGSSLYSCRAFPCLRGCCTTDTCLRRSRVWGWRPHVAECMVCVLGLLLVLIGAFISIKESNISRCTMDVTEEKEPDAALTIGLSFCSEFNSVRISNRA